VRFRLESKRDATMKDGFQVPSVRAESAAAFLLTVGLSACVATATVAVSTSDFPKIEPVSPTVPKECAAFIGGWAGTWPSGNFGQLHLWVTSINENCDATYIYIGRDGVAKIVKGDLTVPCGGGTCNFFRRHRLT
jgi:hypothetical protein